jgi:hypothetical protein
MVKPFRIWRRIRRDNNSNIAKIGIKTYGLIETAGSYPVVSLKLLDPIPRSQLHRQIGSRGFNNTAESASAV